METDDFPEDELEFIEQLAEETEEWFDENPICTDCNGSGEGMYDGTTCHTCHGRGTTRRS